MRLRNPLGKQLPALLRHHRRRTVAPRFPRKTGQCLRRDHARRRRIRNLGSPFLQLDQMLLHRFRTRRFRLCQIGVIIRQSQKILSPVPAALSHDLELLLQVPPRRRARHRRRRHPLQHLDGRHCLNRPPTRLACLTQHALSVEQREAASEKRENDLSLHKALVSKMDHPCFSFP
jgi:hypothetical protein